jgi:hypothetical protein
MNKGKCPEKTKWRKSVSGNVCLSNPDVVIDRMTPQNQYIIPLPSLLHARRVVLDVVVEVVGDVAGGVAFGTGAPGAKVIP